MNEQKFGARKWLWYILAGVIVIAAAFVAWNRYGVKSSVETTTSPIPAKSVALSPTAGTTATPTAGKTSTPASTSTPTATPTSTITQTPPAGWKSFDISLIQRGSSNSYSFAVFGKNGWDTASNYSPAYQKSFVDSGLVDISKVLDPAYYYALLTISGLADVTPAQSFQTPDGQTNISLYFNGRSLTTDEKNIIINSFRFK